MILFGVNNLAQILTKYSYGLYCDIILKESIRFRAATKRTAYTKDKLLWMWFFPIVPSRGTLATDRMGIVSFPGTLKVGNYCGLQRRNRLVLRMIFIFGHASQTFHGEVFKNIWKAVALGRMDIAPSQLFHRRMSALRTQADIKFPDCL